MASTARLRRSESLPPDAGTGRDGAPISQSVVARAQAGPAATDAKAVEPGSPSPAAEDEIDMDFWVSVPPLARCTIRGPVVSVRDAVPAPPPDDF